MRMIRKYKEIKKINLSKAITNICEDMIKTNPQVVDDMHFAFNVVEDENGLCLNILVYYPNSSGIQTWRTYRVDKGGNIITWVQERGGNDAKEANEKLLRESAQALSKTMLNLDEHSLLFHVDDKDSQYNLHVLLEKEGCDEK